MAANKTATAEGLIYKGHPLRRVDNLIYYGTMAEKYIIMMQVLDTKKEQDLDRFRLRFRRSVNWNCWKSTLPLIRS